MNAFSSASDDIDTEALRAPIIVKLAAGACMLTGAFTIGLGIQTSLMFRMSEWIPLIIALMVGLGMASLVIGFSNLRAKFGATLAGVVTSACIAISGGAWLVTSIRSGVLSPLALWIVVLAMLALILSAVALGPAKKVSAARAALKARGFDFGV